MNAVVSTVRSTCWPSPRWLGGLFVVLTLAVFWPVRDFQFVNYDDPEYVTANPHVLGGLTASNVAWAFTTGEMGSWHPLTWLSLQADAQFFGVSPRAFHLTNLALHLANTLLVFSLLLALMGAQRGEFAAAVVEYQLAFAHGLATPELRDNLTRAQAALK